MVESSIGPTTDRKLVRQRLRDAAIAAAIGALYFTLAKLGLLLGAEYGDVSPVWPASGVGIAAVYLFGRRICFVVALSAMVAWSTTPIPLVAAVAIGAGNALEALVGAELLRWSHTRVKDFDEPFSFVGLLVAAFFSPLVSAGIDVASLGLTRSMPWENVGETAWTLWFGHGLGALLVTPALLVLPVRLRRGMPGITRCLEIAAVVLTVSLACFAAYAGRLSEGCLLLTAFLALLWVASSIGVRGVNLATSAIACLCLWWVGFGGASFLDGRYTTNLVGLQLLLGALAIAAILVVKAERNRKRLLPGMIVLIGVGFSVTFYGTQVGAVQRQNVEHFDAVVVKAQRAIVGAINADIGVLRGGARLVRNAASVTRADWRTYVEMMNQLEHTSKTRCMGVLEPVAEEQLEQWLESTRENGTARLSLHAADGSPHLPAMSGDLPSASGHLVVRYVEPLECNRSLPGLDIASDPARLAAALASRDSGEPLVVMSPATGPDDGCSSPTFFLLLPYYSEDPTPKTVVERRYAHRGWVFESFAATNLLEGVPNGEQRELDVSLFDGDPALPGELLCSTAPDTGAAARVERTTLIQLGGRSMTLGWNRGHGFVAADARMAGWLGVAATLCSLLLAGVVSSLLTRSLSISEERFELAIRSSNDALWDWDGQPEGIFDSSCLKEVLGYANDEFENHFGSFVALLHPEDRDPVVAAVNSHLKERTPFDCELRLRTKAGDYKWFRARGTAVFSGDGSPTRMAGSFNSIDERKAADQHLKQTTDDLVDGLTTKSRLNEDLGRLKEAAEAANRAKSVFLANMSHEIRTPLNAILGMAELLDASELSAGQRRHVQVLRNAGEALIHLIGDVLDLAKVEAAKIELEFAPFDLHEMLESMVELLAVGAHRKKLYVTLEVEPSVPRHLIGDQHRLRQILLNLLGNAVKFTDHGGIKVRVALDATVDDRARIRVSIRDTGIGIPPEMASDLFKPFSQIDATTARAHGGSGLGLSLCERLVGLMAGRIWFDSVPGSGSTFHFTAELSVDAGATAGDDAPSDGLIGRGRTALVVDDTVAERNALRHLLERWGFQVTEAEGGGSGIAAIAQAFQDKAPFDVVLLDARMPTMGGLEVVEAIQELPGVTDHTIVLLTADHRESDIERCETLGVAASLVKPIRGSALLSAIRQIGGGAKAPKGYAGTTPRSVAAPTKLTGSILVADDSEDNRFVIVEYLKNTGLTVECVENGEEAVAKASTGNFDLILMDLHMPVMDGLTAVHAIRNVEDLRHVRHMPIVALTADALASDRERSIRMGCDDHLSKPISRRALLDALRRHLDRPVEELGPDILELATEYLERRASDVAVLRSALDAGEYAKVERLGHNMKGSGGSYGFPDITRVGARLEAAGKASEPTETDRGIVELDACVKRLREARTPCAQM